MAATHECSACLKETIKGADVVEPPLVVATSACHAERGDGVHRWTKIAQTQQQAVLPEYECVFRFGFEQTTFIDENGMEQPAGMVLILEAIPKEFSRRYGTSSIPHRMYIRTCYVELYDQVSNEMLSQNTSEPAMLFTGVPGIGKSMFMIYFLCRFQTDIRFTDKRFAFEIGSGIYHYFNKPTASTSPDGKTNLHFVCSRSVDSHVVPLDEILVVADISELAQPRNRAKWTLIFSSPNPDRYKEFMKGTPSYTFRVPTWSEFELRCVNEDIASWYPRFVICGGVPRLVFWNGVGHDPMRAISVALRDKGAAVADYFFKHGFGDVDRGKNYSLIHINPPSCDGTVMYDCCEDEVVHTFASDHIFNELKKKFTSGLVADAVNLFNTGGGLIATEKLGVVSAGHLFEKICLWLVPLSGTQISMVKLPLTPDSTPEPIDIPSTVRYLAHNWKTLQDHEIGVFYQPLIANLEAGDSFFLIDHGTGLLLVILQVTVAVNHPIKANGIKNIVQSYPEEIRNQISRKVILFVTPSDGKLSKCQPIHSKDDKVMDLAKIPADARNFEQLVYRHNIPT